MKKEKTEVGDIRIDPLGKKPQLCMEVKHREDGSIELEWMDYDLHLLHTTLGMCPDCHTIDTLERFNEVQETNIKEKDEKEIKIRYAYITSSTNVKEDPFYHKDLTFRVLTLDQLESQKASLSDMLTCDTTVLIRILGRDSYTGWKDMDGKEIYKGDIVRWYTKNGEKIYSDETVDENTRFYDGEIETDCKVIGNIYKQKRGEI